MKRAGATTCQGQAALREGLTKIIVLQPGRNLARAAPTIIDNNVSLVADMNMK